MIVLSLTSAIFTSGGKSRSRGMQRSRQAVAVARIAALVLQRPAGLTGTLGRLALLMIAGGFSYFVGAGLAELMMKAPIPVALMFGAAFAALLSREPDRS